MKDLGSVRSGMATWTSSMVGSLERRDEAGAVEVPEITVEQVPVHRRADQPAAGQVRVQPASVQLRFDPCAGQLLEGDVRGDTQGVQLGQRGERVAWMVGQIGE